MKNLSAIRTEHGISQAKLAEILFISQQSIHHYETGHHEPNIDMMIKMADFFGTTVDYLIGYSDVREKNIEFGNAKLTKKQLLHMKNYLELSPKNQKIVNMIIRELARGDENENTEN